MCIETSESSMRAYGVDGFAKFYDCFEYAEAMLRKGELYMRPIRSFACDDDGNLGTGRLDPYEAVASPIMIESPGKPIFCCSYFGKTGLNGLLASPDGSRLIEEIAGCDGAVVVVEDPAEFVDRIYRAVPEGFRYGPIRYGGDMFGVKEAFLHPGEAAFLKNRRYAYQHEFRIVLNIDQPLQLKKVGESDGIPIQRQYFEPRTVSIGSIEDIARIMTVDQLKTTSRTMRRAEVIER